MPNDIATFDHAVRRLVEAGFVAAGSAAVVLLVIVLRRRQVREFSHDDHGRIRGPRRAARRLARALRPYADLVDCGDSAGDDPDEVIDAVSARQTRLLRKAFARGDFHGALRWPARLVSYRVDIEARVLRVASANDTIPTQDQVATLLAELGIAAYRSAVHVEPEDFPANVVRVTIDDVSRVAIEKVIRAVGLRRNLYGRMVPKEVRQLTGWTVTSLWDPRILWTESADDDDPTIAPPAHADRPPTGRRSIVTPGQGGQTGGQTDDRYTDSYPTVVDRVTAHQLLLMTVIEDGINGTGDIAAKVGRDWSNTQRSLTRLQTRGFVRRTSERSWLLTEEGRSLLPEPALFAAGNAWPPPSPPPSSGGFLA